MTFLHSKSDIVLKGGFLAKESNSNITHGKKDNKEEGYGTVAKP